MSLETHSLKHRSLFGEISRLRALSIAWICPLIHLGCWPANPPPVVFEPEPREIASESARDPQPIVRASGAIAMTLVQPAPGGGEDIVLHRSESSGDVYHRAVRVNTIPGEVRSHGEGAPRLLASRAGRFYAVWLARTSHRGNTVRVARSDDFLRSFRDPVTLETGEGPGPSFFSAELAPDDTLIVAWLGRGAGRTRPGTMQLMVSSSRDLGRSFGAPVVAASNACPCCRPAIGADHTGRWYVAWRDTDANHVRNIVVATSSDRGLTWSEPIPVPGEPWRIEGCPHAGPALLALESELFIAWYTEASGTAKLLGTRSTDGGRSYSEPIDLGGPVADPNHPDLAVVNERIFVVFQGRDADDRMGFGRTRIYVREVGTGDSAAPIAVPRGRGSAAYPTIDALGSDKLLVSWTDTAEEGAAALAARGRIASP